MNSFTEENYLKGIFALTEDSNKGASTNSIAQKMGTKASSVSDMIKKLADKKLVNYKKYQGVTLSKKGREIAINIIRKHRLWEVFLVEKLSFGWDEVHDIAEQLEHIPSKELTNRLDDFLGNPKFDPHGDPIPDKDGQLMEMDQICFLSDLKMGERGIIVGVNDSSNEFLQYLESQKLILGTELEVQQIFDFDKSLNINIKKVGTLSVSNMVGKNLNIKKIQ